MDSKAALKKAKKLYPGLKPTQVSGFAVVEDCVIITGHEEDVAVILFHMDDIYRCHGACQILIDAYKKQKAAVREEAAKKKAAKK
jgi:hypothetical protein